MSIDYTYIYAICKKAIFSTIGFVLYKQNLKDGDYMQDCSIIIKRIEALCKDKSVSKTRAFSEAGVNRSIIDNLKKGSMPTVEKLSALADYFEVSVDYLLGKTNQKQRITTFSTDEDLKFALFNGTDGITDAMYEEVKQFAQMVKMREEAKNKGE